MSRYEATPIVSRDVDVIGRTHHVWVDTREPRTGSPYRFADLFCGCGGLMLGCRAAGLRVVLAVDEWAPAAATHRLNHPGTWLHEGDIRRLSDRRIRSGLGDELPDVIVGGPPCRKYSTAGDQDTGHPTAHLYLEYLRVVAALRPHVCVIENVPGLLQPKCQHVLHDAVRRLGDLGYVPSVQVLNAAWYGVPQTRERVIIVANRHGLPNPYPRPLLWHDGEFIRTRQVLLDLADRPRDLQWSHDWPVHDRETTERLAAVRCGESLGPAKQGYRRLIAHRPAWTVTDNHGAMFIHPWLPRVISAREMARLQAFPDDCHFRGNLGEQMHQIGNAVPPPLARHIALAVRTLLDEVA